MEAVNNFSFSGLIDSVSTGSIGGAIESLFGQSEGRKRQIFIRDLAASVNGYPGYQAFIDAGEPWHKEPLIEFYRQVDAKYPGFIAHDDVSKYPSINSGYLGINYQLGTNLDQFKNGELDNHDIDELSNQGPYTLQAGSTNWGVIVLGILLVIMVVYFVAGKGKK